jgi:anti-anti-sigma factor
MPVSVPGGESGKRGTFARTLTAGQFNRLEMKFTLDKQDTYSILSLDEENLNSLIAPDLKSEFIFLRNEGVRNLIFDLSHVKYVDSSGLSAILTANRLWKDYGSYVITGIAHPSVEKLIKISRLDTILAIVPTVTESIDYIQMEDAERQLQDSDASEEE